MNGDGWIIAGDGEPRWGLYGAAGLLLRYTDEAGVTRYLLAERSPYVHCGGTWGIPGGALRRDESAEDGARREAEEEFGALPAYIVAEVVVDDAGGWTYSTVVADVAEPVALEPLTWEHTRTRWVTPDEMTHLVLHPGLAGLAPFGSPAESVHGRPVLANGEYSTFAGRFGSQLPNGALALDDRQRAHS